jgi:uridine phosphorylase
LIQYLIKQHPVKKFGGFLGDFFLLQATQNRIGVAGNFGIGAPAAAVLVEELAAFGVRRFLSIGLAGGLQPDLRSGDVVVCDRAIRDEGTSYHYLPPSRFADASQAMVTRLTRAFSARGIAHTVGASWTTDAPYRETRREVECYRQAGVKTVDMEAAALFAVGQYLQVEVAAAFVISDTLTDLRWQPAVNGQAYNLQLVLDTAIQALTRSSDT